jgi:hypothetical protein
VVHLANKHTIHPGLHLCMTTKAQVRVALNQHAPIHRAVWIMTSHAAFAQGFVLEDVRLGLLLVAANAHGVSLLRAQATGDLMDILAVWFVTINTGHAALENAMMVRERKFAMSGYVTFETGQWIRSRINDVHSQAGLDVLTSGSVTRLAASQRSPLHIVAAIKPAVRATVKAFVNFIVAIGAGLVANERRTGNLRRYRHSGWRVGGRGAGNQDGAEQGKAKQRGEIRRPSQHPD